MVQSQNNGERTVNKVKIEILDSEHNLIDSQMINSYLLSGEKLKFWSLRFADILTKHDVYVKVVLTRKKEKWQIVTE